MRVLQVIPSLGSRTGGAAESVVQSSRFFGALGVETSIFSTDLGTPASSRTQRRVAASELPSGAAELDIRLYPAVFPERFAFSPALERALRRETPHYDVVHIHSLFLFPQLAAYRHARRSCVPHVVTPHGVLDPYHRQHGRARKFVTDVLWQRRLLEQAAAIHVTAEEEAMLVADVAPRVRRIVAPIGVHWDQYQSLPDGGEFRRRYLGGHEGPVVMHIGRLSHKKAPDVLVRAFALVAHDVPDARLVFVGPDDEGREPLLQALAGELGIAPKVTFAGMLPGEHAKISALAAADVWALPSNAENFGIAVMEALAAGRAAVISPRVNIAPAIAAADAAIVVEQDPQRFGAAIVALLGDPLRRAVLGANAREFARRYDWATVARPLAHMYFDVVEGSSPAAGTPA